MSAVLMACGCAGAGTHVGAHDGLPERHPNCFTHDCCTVASNPPDLSNRIARCSYFGKRTGTYRQGLAGNECNFDGRRDVICKCEQPSSPSLPFFAHKPTAEKGAFYCGCMGWD